MKSREPAADNLMASRVVKALKVQHLLTDSSWQSAEYCALAPVFDSKDDHFPHRVFQGAVNANQKLQAEPPHRDHFRLTLRRAST
jgi:hypothetical protein